MPFMTPDQAGSLNRCAFMDMLASSAAEGTSSSPITRNDGYDIIVSGVDGDHSFADYSTHPFANGRPAIVVNSKGLHSTASGRYQFLVGDWAHYKALLSLPDFSPLSQDKWALQLIKERRALDDIDAGDLDAAVELCTNIWASLPGNTYGQHQATLESLKAAFILNGGTLKEA